jgi:4-hydroxy-tetrahydrodipicolinate synthase
MTTGTEIRGIYPIVYTPFDEEGEIDEEDLRRLVDHLIDSGAHGLAALGTASESQKMSTSERAWTTRVIMEQTAGRVPVIVGTSAENTKTAIELSFLAQEAGAVCVFLNPATIGPFTAKAMRSHYLAVAKALSIPVMIQHHLIPIASQLMVELSQEGDNIRYVKEEAPDISGHCISEILRLSQGQLPVLSGGMYLPDELARGAVGAIPGSVCVADLVQTYERYRAGDEAGARRAFNHAVPLLYARRQNPFLWAKEVLRRQGIFKVARLREPALQGLDDQDRSEIAKIMETMGPPY